MFALLLSIASVTLYPLVHAQPTPAPNPLLTESTLPLGYPRFDLIRNEHFEPAFAQGMKDHLASADAIARHSDAPTFENTVVALERSGRLLDRVSSIFGNLDGANTNPQMQALQRAMAPKLAAHADAIRLNPVLFARIAKLYDARETLGLDAESKRLIWRSRRCPARRE